MTNCQGSTTTQGSHPGHGRRSRYRGIEFPVLFHASAGRLLRRLKDKELALKCMTAYNDYIIDEWCAAAPGRYIPMIIVPLLGHRTGNRRNRPVRRQGREAIAFSEIVHRARFPSIHSGEWDGVSRQRTKPRCHSARTLDHYQLAPNTSPDAPFGCNRSTSVSTWPTPRRIGCLLGKLQKFPDLKIVAGRGRHRLDSYPARAGRARRRRLSLSPR